jgi:hypothetical protein
VSPKITGCLALKIAIRDREIFVSTSVNKINFVVVSTTLNNKSHIKKLKFALIL